MEDLEKNLKIEASFEKGESKKEFVFRQDEPLKVYDPLSVSLEGVITTPSEFVTKRGKLVDSSKSNVVFSRKGLSITLTVNENDKFKTTITGKLEDNPFLNQLNINKESDFSIAGLRALLKFKKIHFKDPGRHKGLMYALENYKSKIETTYEQFNDKDKKEKGASIKKKISETSADFNFDFVLSTPIFVGGPNVDIDIHVSVEPGDSHVELFIENDEFELLREKEIDRVWQQEMEFFQPFVIVEKD